MNEQWIVQLAAIPQLWSVLGHPSKMVVIFINILYYTFYICNLILFVFTFPRHDNALEVDI